MAEIYKTVFTVLPETDDKRAKIFKEYISNLIPFHGSSNEPTAEQYELLKKWIGVEKVSFTIPDEYSGLSNLPPKWANFVRNRKKRD